MARGTAHAPVPPPLPAGRVVTVPGRGEMFVREAPERAGARAASQSGVHGGGPGGPAIVLLHGWTLSADINWFSGGYEVARRHGPMVAPDLRGHGRGLRSEEPFTLEAATDDVAALLGALGVGAAVIVGYSMGGSIALLLWQRHPELVAGMVLCSTALQYRNDLFERLVWQGAAGVEYVLRWGAPRGITDRYLRHAVEQSPGLGCYCDWLKAEARRGDPSDIAASGKATSLFDARGFAGDIDVPTAVVISRRDLMVRETRQRELAEAVPGAQVVELDAAHNAWMVQPELFAAAIDDAITLVLSRGTPPPPL